MITDLLESNIAVVGGGKFCKNFLSFLLVDKPFDKTSHILGVADANDQAEGFLYAKERGLFTTRDYKELYGLKDLQVIVELTNDNTLGEVIRANKPSHLKLIDHFDARSLWDSLKLEVEKKKALTELSQKEERPDQIFEKFADCFAKIIWERNDRSRKIEKELVEHQRVLSQIIEGSTIPTFVINKDHIVTHWNKALEKLTGFSAEKIIGTDQEWQTFYSQKRPTMADLILDGINEETVWRYYGAKWQKSALIEGAYEAESFFPHLGQAGKWLFFTAAPIKAPHGAIIGAIETLWDKTADKKAEEERERHNRELAAKAEELAASERVMSQIIQGSTIPTFVINQSHIVTHWNKAMENLSGYSAKEIVGTSKQWVPFWEKERPSMADVVLAQIEEEGIGKLYGQKWRRSSIIEGAYEAEVFFPNLGEKGKWCFFTAAPIKTPDGKIVGAIETLWDKTEEKEAEEARERHTKELTALCSIYTALSTSIDLDERLKAAILEIKNSLTVDSIHIFLQDEDGKLYLKLHDGVSENLCPRADEISDDAQSIIQRFASNGKVTIFEDISNGSRCEIGLDEREGLNTLAYIPINTRDENVLGVIRIGSKQAKQFTTEEKNVLELIGNRIGVAVENSMLQEQYVKSEEKYRSLFNNAPNPIFILDSRSYEILDTNQRAQDSYGYDRQELLGVSILQLGDEGDEELVNALKSLSEDQSVMLAKKRHYRKSGRPFYININLGNAKYGESNVIIASTTDITENVEKETQLIQASKMTTLGTMAAGMAHEINQPLNVIQVCADFFLKMIRRGIPIAEEDLKSMANDISDNVQRAAAIIKHMRDFARQSEVVTSKVNINDPITDVFKVMGHQLKVHQIELELELDPDIPPILAEHNRLEQVFINLVTNAIDAMDAKGGLLGEQQWERVLRIKSSSEDNQVLVKVIDTGIGMSREVIDKIFEPFFTTKEVGKGTGLGVSISYGIVKDYDGSIEIESKVGEGTTFILRFPAFSRENGP